MIRTVYSYLSVLGFGHDMRRRTVNDKWHLSMSSIIINLGQIAEAVMKAILIETFVQASRLLSSAMKC